MTNTREMTNTQLQAAYEEACRTSDWHFDDRNYWLAEQWNLKAQEIWDRLQVVMQGCTQ